ELRGRGRGVGGAGRAAVAGGNRVADARHGAHHPAGRARAPGGAGRGAARGDPDLRPHPRLLGRLGGRLAARAARRVATAIAAGAGPDACRAASGIRGGETGAIGGAGRHHAAGPACQRAYPGLTQGRLASAFWIVSWASRSSAPSNSNRGGRTRALPMPTATWHSLMSWTNFGTTSI